MDDIFEYEEGGRYLLAVGRWCPEHPDTYLMARESFSTCESRAACRDAVLKEAKIVLANYARTDHAMCHKRKCDHA